MFRDGYAYHQEQHIVSVKRAMLDSAALHRVVPLSRFDLVLVDDGAPADALRDLDEHQVRYEVCATDSTNATNPTRGGDDRAGAT